MLSTLLVHRCEGRLSTRVGAGGKRNPEHRRKRRGRRPPPQKEAQSHKPAPLPAVTAPPVVSTTEVLQASLPALDPWWSTFIGHSAGVWAGKCGAFNMADGCLETMTLEGDNISVKELHTRVKEVGGEVDGKEALLRESLKQIRLKHIEQFPDHAEKSCLMAHAPGLLHFDGGSYSLSLSDIGTNSVEVMDESELSDTALFGTEGTADGWQDEGLASDASATEAAAPDQESTGSGVPDAQADERSGLEERHAAAPPAASAEPGGDQQLGGLYGDLEGEEEWQEVAREEMLQEQLRGTCKVAVLEHCLAESGSERVRLQLLLQTRGGRSEELDVQVLRLVMFKELWMGAVEHGSQPPLHKINIGDAKRARPDSLSGDFHTLTLTAAVVEGDSGDEPVKACFSREAAQAWGAPSDTSSEEGVCWWLPHDVTVTLMMAPERPQHRQEGDEEPMALVVRSTWKRDTFVSVMETEFTASGVLREARFSSLVPAVNSIPSMQVPVRA
eukprot:jgi/Ulvmu1/4086/UM019_0065.1